MKFYHVTRNHYPLKLAQKTNRETSFQTMSSSIFRLKIQDRKDSRKSSKTNKIWRFTILITLQKINNRRKMRAYVLQTRL